MIKVAIVEDIDDIRNGIAMIIDASDGMKCVYSFATAEQAIQLLTVKPVDVVLVDINLPGDLDGLQLIEKLKAIHPNTQFLICTIYEDADLVFRALKIGATGYILKNTPSDRLVAAIHEINSGGSPITASIARKVIFAFQRPALNESANLLTKREHELLELLAQGFRYKEIAEKLSLSIDTIRSHVRNIYRKLEVQSRAEALNKVYPRK